MQEITDIMADNKKVRAKLEEQEAIIESLALPFENTFAVNCHTGEAFGFRVDPNIEDFLGVKNRVFDYEKCLKLYADNIVIEEDRYLFYEMTPLGKAVEVLMRERIHSFIYRRKLDGELVYFECMMIMANPEKKDFVVAFRNINEEKHLAEVQQRKLDEAYLAATEANKAKTHFLFNMSHDIRTPMNAIIGFRDLLEKNQEDPVKRQDYLNKIKTADEVLLSIINNVLEMTRIEQNNIEIDETATGLSAFVDAVRSMFQTMMEEKGLEFCYETHVEHEYVYCDVTKTREIMINLLSNAYKYTNPGGRVTMRVEELPSKLEGYVLYQTSVTDTGIGMGEDFLPHLFDAFARENNTTDAKVEGTGLGMPIVKRLVDLMHGTIEVKSVKDQGTTIVVTLPHRIADPDKCYAKMNKEVDLSLFEGKRILLVEDNDLNAEIAMELLQDSRFMIERAENGRICIDMMTLAPEDYYDLVLMDIQMPEMNGYEAAVTIRKMSNPIKANIPIIAMTANAFEEDKSEAMRCGMNGHLSKPVCVKDMLRLFSKILS
ncbi:MAG: ATP-binding protein [Bacteroidales bacterium]|nr:ATP-binding protein [Bacteroidales bacterium]